MADLTFSGSVPAPASVGQTLVLPFTRVSPLHIPRRDLVLAGADSMALRVTVAEADDPDSGVLELSGGLGGPLARLVVWYEERRYPCFDYGWPFADWRPILALDSVVSTAAGSFDFFLSAGALAGLPRLCGWSFHLTWDDGTGGVVPVDGAPILVSGGWRQSECLAVGSLQVRRVGIPAAVPEVGLLTDAGDPLLADIGAGDFTSDFTGDFA